MDAKNNARLQTLGATPMRQSHRMKAVRTNAWQKKSTLAELETSTSA
jgi:hypothetical protein